MVDAGNPLAGGDPELSKVTDVVTPVELDHIITVPIEFLNKATLPLEWSHNFHTKSDTYYQLVFTNTTKGNAKYYLFVSSGKLDAFKKLDATAGKDGKLTIKVTKGFQYGQKDKTGRNRFLVYYEADWNDVKQGRFIKAAWLKYGNMASGFIDNFKKDEDASKVLDLLTKFIGDSLRKF
ncbi:hypothetical protein GQ44DRAFT_734077 [Phaeosphaeriaceae sp. PMI808]|nr:hypothetical protein GQ44DRAFT_734077 [Phaeosphaeriaceae sp. PMI808]